MPDLLVIALSVIHLLKQIWFRLEKKQQNRRLLSQLDDFDQDVILDDAVSSEQQNVIVNNVIVNNLLRW